MTNLGSWAVRLTDTGILKVKVGVLRPVQHPGSYWDRSSELPLVGLEPTEVTAYMITPGNSGSERFIDFYVTSVLN